MRPPRPPRVPGVQGDVVLPPKAEPPVAPTRSDAEIVQKRSPDIAISMAPRLDEKHRAERRALIHRAGTVVGGAILVLLAGWVIFFSPLFALHTEEITIEIHGDGLSTEAVDDVLAPFEGVPLTRLRTSTVESRITEIGGIEAVSVERDWPHSLTATVTVRTPVAAVPTSDGYQLFGANGEVLHTSTDEPEGLPIIATGVNENTPATIDAILLVLGSLDDDLLSEISTISATSEQTITFILSDGATVKWGDSTENELKSAVLQTLRQVEARMYDVSAPRTPVTSN